MKKLLLPISLCLAFIYLASCSVFHKNKESEKIVKIGGLNYKIIGKDTIEIEMPVENIKPNTVNQKYLPKDTRRKLEVE